MVKTGTKRAGIKKSNRAVLLKLIGVFEELERSATVTAKTARVCVKAMRGLVRTASASH